MSTEQSDIAFGVRRPRLEDGPSQLRARSRALVVVVLALALLAPSLCLPHMHGAISADVYHVALLVIAAVAAPLLGQLHVLGLRSIRIRAGDLMLSDRDLDQVVDYARALGVSTQAKARAAGNLTYPAIESFLDWMEQQALLLRAKGV